MTREAIINAKPPRLLTPDFLGDRSKSHDRTHRGPVWLEAAKRRHARGIKFLALFSKEDLLSLLPPNATGLVQASGIRASHIQYRSPLTRPLGSYASYETQALRSVRGRSLNVYQYQYRTIGAHNFLGRSGYYVQRACCPRGSSAR